MATASQLLSLVRSHASGDDERFLAVALQVAAEAARRNRTKFAEELRDLVAEARVKTSAIERTRDPIPLARPRGELAGLVSVSYPKTTLSHLVLKPELHQRLARIVKEHRHRQRLAEHGLKPRRKFLLFGPPGSGKTMTAAALAGELSLPLFSLLLDGIITRYMGETAAKLRLVFDAMVNTRGVYLFDEVDALASKRMAANDVGEARRVLNSFLQFLEEDRSDSLVLAATNHPQLLDNAIFRRFDGALEYALPDAAMVRPVIENNLHTFEMAAVDWSEVVAAAEGLSQAELARAAEDAAREAVLDNSGLVTTALLVQALEGRRQPAT